MCDDVNDNWTSKTPVHLAAYVLWRLNWIHPFDDGNGRTSRVVSYLVLLIAARQVLGGFPTIPELITRHRSDYFAALDEADAKLKENGHANVSKMENLISSLLAQQLHSIYALAGGTPREPI